MARLRRRWRVVKWAGLALSTCLLAALVLSLYCGISYSTGRWTPRTTFSGGVVRDIEDLHYFNLCDGGLFYHYSPIVQATLAFGWRLEARSSVLLTRSPSYHVDRTLASFGLPLWIPLLLAAVPTIVLFRRDRRTPSHCCHSCGYDLTGNTSGTCPECGGRL